MQQGETIYDVQKRFTHIVNHLTGLGTNKLNIKILKSLNRTWQPEVIAITESQNRATMTMATLLGKLREHELELGRLNEEEDLGRKKNIAFKSEVIKGNISNSFIFLKTNVIIDYHLGLIDYPKLSSFLETH